MPRYFLRFHALALAIFMTRAAFALPGEDNEGTWGKNMNPLSVPFPEPILINEPPQKVKAKTPRRCYTSPIVWTRELNEILWRNRGWKTGGWIELVREKLTKKERKIFNHLKTNAKLTNAIKRQLKKLEKQSVRREEGARRPVAPQDRPRPNSPLPTSPQDVAYPATLLAWQDGLPLEFSQGVPPTFFTNGLPLDGELEDLFPPLF